MSIKNDVWEKVLEEYCHCYQDSYGNRPCDNGEICDRCMSSDIQDIYENALNGNNRGINFDPCNFNGMLQLMDLYGDSETPFTGENDKGEYVTISVFPDRIVTVTYQENDTERENTYHRDGTSEEIFRH